jgi:signal peptidase II
MRAWVIAASVLAADQLSKQVFLSSWSAGDSMPILPPVLYFTYVQNTGAAFGLFKGQQLAFMITTIAIIVWIVFELRRAAATFDATQAAYGLILGGAIGNLIDRARLGFVVDFIDLRVWPVFNIGDSGITIGVCLLIFLHLWGRPRRA